MEPPVISDGLQLNESVTPQPLVGLPYHDDHAAHEGRLEGSVPSSDAIGANPEYALSLQPLELGFYKANGDVLVIRTEVSSLVQCSIRSVKRDHPPRGIDDFLNLEGELGNDADPAVPRFSKLPNELKTTLLDLILGMRFLKGNCSDDDYKFLAYSCRWLSVLQNRSLSDIYDDVGEPVGEMKLVRLSMYSCCSRIGRSHSHSGIEVSHLRVYDTFVKKVIKNIPRFDSHRYIRLSNDIKFMSGGDLSVLERIKVLKLDGCRGLESVDFEGLRRLRSLCIGSCPVLKEVTGWKFLRELAWLEIFRCPSYDGYPDFQSLPSIKECRFSRGDNIADGPPKFDLGISQCLRLRTLKIEDKFLEESGDLSSLKCLEVLSFAGCPALSTITGLSGLHSLTRLNLMDCEALKRLPDLSHMKKLTRIDVDGTGFEEIPGVENLVSLETLDWSRSKLKHLPDFCHLPKLREMWIEDIPLADNPLLSYFKKAWIQF